MNITAIPLDQIDLGDRLRAVDEEYAQLIAASMQEDGQRTPIEVRAADAAGKFRLAKAVAASLSGHDRVQVARDMSDYLGRPVSKAMIDAYASVARDDHVIPTPRFMALLQVTSDRRLLEFMAEPLGWAVIERRYLPMITLAAVREREDELRRQAKTRGVL